MRRRAKREVVQTGLSRRTFLRLLGTSAALAGVPRVLRAQGTVARVVVVGGGFAGATAAKYLRHWGGNAVDVTLVDANANHVSCILSNLVVTGSMSLGSITFSYDTLRDRYGVRPVRDRVVAIDGIGHRIRLANGSTLPFDRAIVAPGIDFDALPGWNANAIPHAWQAGPQTTLLRQQLAAMPAGGVFVMTIPPAPYRCPPGPYERACVVADYLRRKKPGSKIIVLDANPGIVAEKETFTRAFQEKYRGTVIYVPGVTVTAVDASRRELHTSVGRVRGNVVNLIPRQRAGLIAATAGLVNDPSGRWAGVNPLSYESTAMPNVHVIGDAQATGQPKAGHIANGEAKVCADAILRAFRGEAPDPAPQTNSACYSPITSREASWLTGAFAYDPASGTMKPVAGAGGEAKEWNSGNFEKMMDWAVNLFSDTFA